MALLHDAAQSAALQVVCNVRFGAYLGALAPAPRGVATGWTGVDMSTPLLPEVVPEIDANPASFNWGNVGGGGDGGRWDLMLDLPVASAR